MNSTPAKRLIIGLNSGLLRIQFEYLGLHFNRLPSSTRILVNRPQIQQRVRIIRVSVQLKVLSNLPISKFRLKNISYMGGWLHE